MEIINNLRGKGKQAALDKLLEECWELVPCALRGLVCCLAPGGRLLQIKALNGCFGCFLPPRAKEKLGKLFELADEVEADNKA